MSDEIVIEAGGANRQYFRDLWRYRELLLVLAWRDLAARYKQTAVGVAWALLRPLLTAAIFTFLFHNLAKLGSGDVPYPLFVFAGTLAWQFFSSALGEAGTSMVGNAALISKVYFPRMLIPIGAIAVAVVDTLISLAFMIALAAWYRFWPDWHIVTLPLFFALAIAFAIGAALWLSALTVRFRDFRLLLPLLLQCSLLVSPVGYASDKVPERWRLLYACNPLVGIIDGFRWALLRGEVAIDWPTLGMSVGVTALIVVSGVWYFRGTERTFADVL
jgi:lipopolysaccharide transport system permease protein